MEQPPAGSAAAAHKTYVFVDEYNRHKRLKVMRACDGCRKRKIRCDGALQNGPWPCGACTRLKLKCIPPTLDNDDEQQLPDGTMGPGQFVFSTAAQPSSSRAQSDPNPAAPQQWSGYAAAIEKPDLSSTVRHDVGANAFSSQIFSNPLGPRLDRGFTEAEYFASNTAPVQIQQPRGSAPHVLRTQSGDSGADPQEVDARVRELSEQMGELAIDLSSAAPYITNEKKTLAETPAVEELDVVLPPSVGSDLTVRIPPEMMPSEERAMDYFGYFFEYVHPYVPVLDRHAFYEQWRTARHSISPLILEGIFACVARYLEEPIEVRKWLALASRHEESFRDVPRISTIQALMILTKAREFVPKRGYYYRSWMAVKYMTTMAFDLGIHEHLDKHQAGIGCGLSTSDCTVRTRMWQTLFGLEVWVGAPQGRTDFAVEYETIEFRLPTPSPDIDPFEHRATRRNTFLAQAVQNVKQTNVLWQRMRRQNPEWALDPTFVSRNDLIATWYKNLPPDMQIHYTDEDTPPYLGGDHFVAGLHTYHHLIVMMQHRPQLQTLLEKRNPSFKAHLDVCNDAASRICRLHEALYRDFGLHGLQFMQRGIGMTIYCVLTCIMMHLASITSPDSATNSRARNLFTRHMRVLELCAPSASQEVQVQINALREAFSQDTSQPFELKPNLGLRSPASDEYPTPVNMQASHNPSLHATPSWSHLQNPTSSKNISPATDFAPPFEASTVQPVMPYTSVPMPAHPAYAPPGVQQTSTPPQTGFSMANTEPAPVWDPSGIFQQWNTAFGAQQPPQQPTVNDPRLASTSASIIPPHPGAPQGAMFAARQTPPNAVPEMSAVPTVTPMMWQDAFTNAYISGGHKRTRDDSVDYGSYSKRRG
ncbi:uncharacterized protein LTR77_003940 [Saxophila tyrrhenica]|uniref:Zn(2)-C6 fungal-type domain-containing protein n=1 Tax=Saxophila tyrrhenica TaxID=1690608 RepID=A0AAV9PJ37_9PEZI|nr:hypothetical protein LTR77_003940 [Saxophila tyrrhenica]